MPQDVGLQKKIMSVESQQAKTKEQPFTLNLKDAIFLALRNNSSIKSTELNRITQKYSVVVAKHAFEPNYTLTGSYLYSQSSSGKSNSYSTATNLTPAVSLKDVYGTTFSLNMSNPLGRYYNPSLQLQVLQPLLRGFGREITEAALRNALDTEEINKLMLKKNVSNMVVTIISNYFNWVLQTARLKIDQQTLASYERNVTNDELKLSLGKIAKNDLVQDLARVAGQKVSIESDLNSISQARLTLLKNMGLDADTPIKAPEDINYEEVVNIFKGPYLKSTGDEFPKIEKCLELTFANDPTYKSTEYTLRQTRRNLAVAENNMRWQLNLTATAQRGGGSGGGANAGIESLLNARNHSEQARLDLTIPVDDVNLKASLLNTRVALQAAEINFRDLKRQMEINVFNMRNTAISDYKRLQLNRNALELQRKTVEIAQLKHDYGKISSFELIKDQETLHSTEINFLQTEVNYLNGLRDFNETMGVTLEVWGIELRDFDHAKID